MTTVYVLNGPNLNLPGALGSTDHGHPTLADMEQRLRRRASLAHADLVFLQSNHEGDLIDWVQEAAAAGAPVVLNAGAYALTSRALPETIRRTDARVVEVQPTLPQVRDDRSPRSLIAPVAIGTIAGFGARAYEIALEALLSADPNQSDE